MKNENFKNLFDNTTKHLKDKKYLYKPISRVNGKIQYEGNSKNLKFNESTPHKITFLTLAFNMALENYKNYRSPHIGGHKLNNLDTSTDILLRFFNEKHYKTIEDGETNESAKLIDENQNYNYKIFNDFLDIEHKLFKTINLFRNYHSHYIHEPGILSFEDFFNASSDDSIMNKKDFEEAKNWFKKRFDNVKQHLLNSLTNRDGLLQEELENCNDSKRKKHLEKKIKSINAASKFFTYKLNFLNEDNKTISLDAQLFIASVFLTKRQATIIIDKWRGVKDATDYQITKNTFFTYYCIKESYSLNNYNDNLLKFREITAKLSNMPFSENENLIAINEAIKELNKKVYEKIEKRSDTSKLKGIITNSSKKILKLEEEAKRNRLSNRDNKSLNELNKIITINSRNIKAIEKLQDEIIPLRKRNILTSVLMQFMIDNDLFGSEFEIAVNKEPLDRLAYINKAPELKNEYNLTHLKNRIKKLNKTNGNVEEINVLKAHFKELKRSYLFKTTNEIKDLIKYYDANTNSNSEDSVAYEDKEYTLAKEVRFSIKKKNALVRYQHKDFEQPINIILSPDLLLKWVFIFLNNNTNAKEDIVKYINKQIKTLSDVEKIDKAYHKNKDKPGFKKTLPKSIIKLRKSKKEDFNKKLIKHIDTKINELTQFLETSNREPKPWKFASSRKINSIFDFLQFMLLHKTYLKPEYSKLENIENDALYTKIEHEIRHASFNIHTYNLAREYFRFFGRYQNNDTSTDLTPLNLKMVEKLKEEYKPLFEFIDIAKNNSLEELFVDTISKYIAKLNDIKKNTKNYTQTQLIQIFKLDRTPNAENINKLIDEKHFIKSLALHPDILKFEYLCKKDFLSFKEMKEKELAKKGRKFFFTDYSFMRYILAKTDTKTIDGKSKSLINTNVDFIIQQIAPKVYTNAKIPASVMRQLLKLKTEELILWNIAKHYWRKANKDAAYDISKLKTTEKANAFKQFTSFNKAYKQDLDYVIEIKPKFWLANNNKKQTKFQDLIKAKPEVLNNTIKIKLQIPAKKYDNKFIAYESSLITEFCLWRFDDFGMNNEFEIQLPSEYKMDGMVYDLTDYEHLLKVIYKELKMSTNFIAKILVAEKKLLENNKEAYSAYLKTKYKDKTSIQDFYIGFGEKIIDDLLKEKVLKDNTDETLFKYIQSFRNYAMHYQLQDPKRVAKIEAFITKYTKEFKNIKNTNEYEHYENESEKNIYNKLTKK